MSVVSEILERRDTRPVDVRANEVLCFLVVRNESLRLPYCLEYHRRLGVSRFFVVDNASTDDTLPFLLEQQDVHVWYTDRSFAAARCGTDWTEMLLKSYGIDRWCLVVDADELLFYSDCETRTVDALCADLDREGKRGLACVLLDMYSDSAINDTAYRRGQDFRAVCPFFDRQHFTSRDENFAGHDSPPSFFGGLRGRVFGGNEPGVDGKYFYTLNKVPLLKYGEDLVLFDNLHWTSCRELADETGCLLHFKYFSSFHEHVRNEASRGEHWNGAIQYARYAEVMDREPGLSLYADGVSMRLRDSRQLAELGVIRPPGGPALAPAKEEPPATAGPADPKLLVRQVRDMIRAHKTSGVHPHEAGVALAKQGRFDEAVASYRRAIELNPEFSWSHHNLGEVLALQKRWAPAAAAFRRSIELNPLFALSHASLGGTLSELDRNDEAAAAYREAIRLQPNLASAIRGLARAIVRVARAQLDEAKELYGRAHELDPDDAEVYREALDIHPVDADLCARFADSLASRGQTSRALVLYQLALQVRPDEPAILAKLARLLETDGDEENAAACYRRAVALQPDHGDYHRALGELFGRLGRVAEAIESLERAIELDPHVPGTVKLLGDLLAKLGRIDEASAAYARAVELGYKTF